MAKLAKNQFDMQVQTEYMKHHLHQFVRYRYHEAFMNEVPNFFYEISVDYNLEVNRSVVKVRSGNGFLVMLNVAAGIEFQVQDKDDWMCYQLQALEPLMDTLIFTEWLWNQMNFDDKITYKKHLQGTLERAVFIPPQVERGRFYRSPYDRDGRGEQVAPDWLVRVEFDNGAVRREIIQNIRGDAGTWVAMMLMAKRQQDLHGDT